MGLPVTYVIGDVGGHAGALGRTLIAIGADPVTWQLPEGVCVVSVGDLIDRGPDSLRCVEIARACYEANDGNYIQLAGNHEANWIEESSPYFNTKSDPAAVAALRKWVGSGGIYLAAAIEGRGRGTLVTHAGMTSALWEALGEPRSALEAAALINNAWDGELHANVVRPGLMLSGGSSKYGGGVYWAEAARELAMSWRATTMPFDQVHGHSSAWRWRDGCWEVANFGEKRWIDEKRRHVITEIGGAKIVGVDPGLWVTDSVSFEAYPVVGAATTPGRSVSDLSARRREREFLSRAY